MKKPQARDAITGLFLRDLDSINRLIDALLGDAELTGEDRRACARLLATYQTHGLARLEKKKPGRLPAIETARKAAMVKRLVDEHGATVLAAAYAVVGPGLAKDIDAVVKAYTELKAGRRPDHSAAIDTEILELQFAEALQRLRSGNK